MVGPTHPHGKKPAVRKTHWDTWPNKLLLHNATGTTAHKHIGPYSMQPVIKVYTVGQGISEAKFHHVQTSEMYVGLSYQRSEPVTLVTCVQVSL